MAIRRDDNKYTALSLAQYDGQARNGEIVIDLDTYNVYVGDASGTLLPISSGGGNLANAIIGNLTVTGTSNLGQVGNITILGGSAGQVLTTDGTGNLSWTTAGGGSGGYGNSNVSVYLAGNIPTDIIPAANATQSLGNVTNQWRDLWLSGNTLYLNGVPLGTNAGSEIEFNGVPLVTVTGSQNIVTTGNGQFNTVTATNGNFTYISGDGSNITNIGNANYANYAGNVVESNQPNITQVGTLVTLVVAGNASVGENLAVTGNLTVGTTLEYDTANALLKVTGTANVNQLDTDTVTGVSPTIQATGVNGGITLVTNGTGNVVVSGAYITNVQDPVNPQDAVTKAYADAIATGLNIKPAVNLATDAPLALPYTYNNGTAGVGAELLFIMPDGNPLVIEGQPALPGYRVLVKNEIGPFVDNTTPSSAFNGVYSVSYSATTVGSITTYFATLTRTTDLDESDEFPSAFVFDEFSGNGSVCTNIEPPPVVVGTTEITWTQFSRAGQYTAGVALSQAGTAFNVNTDGTTVSVNASNQLEIPVNAQLNAPNIGSATGSNLILTGNIGVANATVTGLLTASESNLGPVGNVTLLGGTAGQVITTDGTGNLSFISIPTGYSNADVSAYLDGNIPTNIVPQGNGTQNLGSSANRWNNMWVSGTGTFQDITTANITATNRISGNGAGLSNIAGANVTGQVSFAAVANSVAGANVAGPVASATVAASANSVAGANVTGQVAFAAVANSVAAANIVGSLPSSNYAAYAGNVVIGAQPNITSVGTLATLTVSGNASLQGIVTTVNQLQTETITGVSPTVQATGVNGNVTLRPGTTGNVNVSGAYVTNVRNPVNAQDAVTKSYLDAFVSGFNLKDPVNLATNANLPPYVYSDGADGINATITVIMPNSGPLLIEGQPALSGYRVLIKNEIGPFINNSIPSAAFNGIYTVSYSSAVIGGITYYYTILTRTTDFDAGAELARALVLDEYSGNSWFCTNSAPPPPIVIGITEITWAQFGSSGGTQYTAGSGLQLVGVQFSTVTDGVTVAVNGSNQLSVPPNAQFVTPNIGNATGSNLTVTNTVGAANIVATGLLTASESNLGPVGNVTILGGLSGQFLQTDGTGNLAWANAGGGTANTGNITFANTTLSTAATLGNITLSTYDTANAITNNWAFEPSGNLTLPSNTSSINYANGAPYGGTANIMAIPAVYFVAPTTGNNQTFSNTNLGLYATASDLTVFYNGVLLENSFYTLSGDVLTVNTIIQAGDSVDIIRQFANAVPAPSYVAIPAVYFVAPTTGNNQTFINSTLSQYGTTSDLTVFYNGSLLEEQYYSLSGTALTVNTPLFAGDTIDIPRQLAGNVGTIATTYGDSNVLTYLSSGTFAGNIIPAGNNIFSLGNATNQWKDLWVSNSTIYIDSVPISIAAGNVLTVGNANVVTTSPNGTTATSGVLTVTGNIVANTGYYFLGDGGLLSNINVGSDYSNANVANYLPTYLPTYAGNIGAGNATVTGRVTANTVSLGAGNLSLTGNTLATTASTITIDPLNDGTNAGNVVVAGNLTVGGTLTYNNTVVASTNDLQWIAANNAASPALATGGGLAVGPAGAYASFTFNAGANAWQSSLPIIANGGVNANGALTGATTGSFSGNVTAPYFLGNGSALTGMYGNDQVANYLPTYTGNVGAGNVVSSGNVIAARFIGDGSQLTSLPVQPGTYSNANVQAYLPTYLPTYLSTYTGNVTAGNVTASGTVATSNLAVTGNSVLGSVANVSITGGIPGQVLTTSGTGVLTWTTPAGTYTNANVASYLPTYTGNLSPGNISTTGNILAGALTTTGNAVVGNLITTGNVTAQYFIGDGSLLTGLPVQYGNSDVADYLSSGTVTTDIITIGNISSANTTTVDLTVTGMTHLADIGSVNIPGGNAGEILITDGNGNLSFSPNPIYSVPAVYLVAQSPGNNQQFSNTILASYNSNVDMTVFYNGSLLENTYYTLAGDVITVNIPLDVDDSIDVVTTIAANVNSIVTSAYGNSNVAAYLPTYTGAMTSLTGAVTTTATMTAASMTATNVNATNIAAVDVTTANITAANVIAVNVTGNTLSAGLGNLQLSGNTLSTSADTITIDPLGDGTPAGNVVIAGNLQVTGNLTYNDVVNATTNDLQWIAANNAASASLATGAGLSVGPAGAYASFTYNSGSNAWQSSLPIIANGGVNANGALSGATTGSFSGNVTAPYFIGNGSQLTGLLAGYTDADVATYLASNANVVITTTGNITSTANISANNITLSDTVSATGVITGGSFIVGNVANTTAPKIRLATFGTNSYIQTGNGTAGSTGNIIFSPYSDTTPKVVINTTTGNITANNIGNVAAINLNSNSATFLTGFGTWETAASRSFKDITKLDHGAGYNAILMIADGRLFCMKGIGGGGSWYAALNKNQNVPTQAGINNCYEITFPNEEVGTLQDAGSYGISAYALFDSGNLYTWGYNAQGQLGLGNTTNTFLPTLSNTNVRRVYTHPSQDALIEWQRLVIEKNNGTFWGCGYDGQYQLGLGTNTNKLSWVQLTWITTASTVYNLGSELGCLVVQQGSDNSIWVAGWNNTGALGLGSTTQPTFATVAPLWQGGDSSMTIQSAHLGAPYNDGGGRQNFMNLVLHMNNGAQSRVVGAGSNNWGSLGTGNFTNSTVPVAPLASSGMTNTTIDQVISAGSAPMTVYVLMANNDLYAYGYNQFGQCGNGGTSIGVTTPFKMTTDVIAMYGDTQGFNILGFYSQSPLIKKSTGWFSCGYGLYAQIGNGSEDTNNTTLQRLLVPKDTSFKFVGSYGYNEGQTRIAITDDNIVWAWGFNGQACIDPGQISWQFPVPMSFTPNALKSD